jgi:hypothetical protein
MQGGVWYGKASLGAVRRGKLRQGFDFMDRPCDARQVWRSMAGSGTPRQGFRFEQFPLGGSMQREVWNGLATLGMDVL